VLPITPFGCAAGRSVSPPHATIKNKNAAAPLSVDFMNISIVHDRPNAFPLTS